MLRPTFVYYSPSVHSSQINRHFCQCRKGQPSDSRLSHRRYWAPYPSTCLGDAMYTLPRARMRASLGLGERCIKEVPSCQLWNHGFVYGPFNKLPSTPGQLPEVPGTDWVALDHFFEPSGEACGLPAAR
jgi:hypothetical protein